MFMGKKVCFLNHFHRKKAFVSYLIITFACPKQWSNAAIAQLVEHRLPKPRVTGSSPACRSDAVFALLFYYKRKRLYRI